MWKVIVDGLGILLYAIAMVLFCMIAFIRLLYLWVFIIASPLLLLMFCLENVGKEKISRLENIIKELKEN
ncbi:MAG: hypothetical protein LBP53_02090 [Candidatus Peribacteria bacterium]|nr:hypothetical protein [Candidatus Peribacteria bacterium]